MILVTAAFGNQGRLLVPKLLEAGQPVRACVSVRGIRRGLARHRC